MIISYLLITESKSPHRDEKRETVAAFAWSGEEQHVQYWLAVDRHADAIPIAREEDQLSSGAIGGDRGDGRSDICRRVQVEGQPSSGAVIGRCGDVQGPRRLRG